jgi:hypothetical protein
LGVYWGAKNTPLTINFIKKGRGHFREGINLFMEMPELSGRSPQEIKDF